jgi:cell division protein FtsB
VYNSCMQKRRGKIKDRGNLKKIATIFLMLSFIAFIGYHLFLAVNIANEKLHILEIAQEDVGKLRIQNLELVLEKGEVVSMEYIEKEARDKLRYSSEDEVLFVIPEDLLNSEWIEQELDTAKGSPAGDEERTPEEIFQIWLNFLFSSGV